MALSKQAVQEGVEIFVPITSYETYKNYVDDCPLSIIDENRNINVHAGQVILSSESNSQFICFEMTRYFDGIDFTTMTISIHLLNPELKELTVKPVNVSYSETKIHFAWLIDASLTSTIGEIVFEIVVYGFNEKNQKYIWKSKPNGVLKVDKSLVGSGVISETDPGYLDFLLKINIKTAEALDAARRAEYASASLGKPDIVAKKDEMMTYLDL